MVPYCRKTREEPPKTKSLPLQPLHFPCIMAGGTAYANSSDLMWKEEMKRGSIKLLALWAGSWVWVSTDLPAGVFWYGFLKLVCGEVQMGILHCEPLPGRWVTVLWEIAQWYFLISPGFSFSLFDWYSIFCCFLVCHLDSKAVEADRAFSVVCLDQPESYKGSLLNISDWIFAMCLKFLWIFRWEWCVLHTSCYFCWV